MGNRSLQSTKLTIKLTASVQNTLLDGSSVAITQPNFSFIPVIKDGIEANQASRGWQYSGSLDLDDEYIFNLYSLAETDIGAGVGKDALGQTIVFENIVGIFIFNENDVGTPGRLEITPSHSDGWKPIGSHTVANGGALAGQGMLAKLQLEAGGFDVNSLNSYRLSLHAANGPVDFSIYLLARHDDDESSSSSSSTSSQSSVNSSSSKSGTSQSSNSCSSVSSQSSHNSSSSSSSQSSSSLSRST